MFAASAQNLAQSSKPSQPVMRGTGAEWRDGRENKVGEIKVLKMLKSGGGRGKKEPLDEVGTVEE